MELSTQHDQDVNPDLVAVNPDLAVERAKATFDVKELTIILDGSEDNTEERHKCEKLLSEDPNIPNTFSLLQLSADDYRKSSLKTIKYVHNILDKFDGNIMIRGSQHVRFIACPSEAPTGIHHLLFKPTISRHSTEEQLAEWLPLIENEKVIGAYAQTELGHGSDLKNLETTAAFDVDTDEFVLNCPTLTSTKCWAGGMGTAATHVILMAQLYTKSKCHGLHMFLVQIRDIDDHSSLPGVTVGEMGPKMGIHGTDNGYLHLNHVRIPRKNMFMKFSQVLRDGTYVKPEFERASYGMMVFLRTIFVNESASYLAQAATIAVRYNAVRRQGKIERGGEDVKILDYKTQQYKLFPQVATAYALFFTFKRFFLMYIDLVQNPTAEKQTEYHSLSSGMKAFSTFVGAEGAEICRRACGGVGYLNASRLPLLCFGLIASCTYEGDNTVLELQTSRFLLKSVGLVHEGKAVGKSVEYLKGFRDYGSNTCMLEYIKLFETTTANFAKEIYKMLNYEIDLGTSPECAWQNYTVELVKCAQLHSKVFVIQSLHEFFQNTQLSPSLCAVLENLFQFLAVYWILEKSGDFIEHGKVSVEYITRLRNRQVPQFLRDLRVDIVSLVDAFDFCDATLQSVIGSYDGRVYERLVQYWSELPNNKKQVNVNEKSKL